MSIKRLFFLPYYNFVEHSHDYQDLSNDNREGIFYNSKEKKMVVIIRDSELGKACYENIKEFYSKNISFKFLDFNMTINKFAAGAERIFSFSADCKKVDNEYYDKSADKRVMNFFSMLQILYSLEAKEYYLSKEKFEINNCHTLSGFLSLFSSIDKLDEAEISGVTNKCLFTIFCNDYGFPGGLEEVKDFFDKLLKRKGIFYESDSKKDIPIVMECYKYYKEGDSCFFNRIVTRKSLTKAIIKSSMNTETYAFRKCFIADVEAMKEENKIIEETSAYIVFEGNIKIYRKKSDFYFFLKDIKEFNDFLKDTESNDIFNIKEKVENVVLDFNQTPIGYVFKKSYITATPVLEKKFESFIDILEFFRNLKKILKSFYGRKNCKNAKIEEKLSVTDSGDIVFSNSLDFFNLVKMSNESVDQCLSKFFYEIYERFLMNEYGNELNCYKLRELNERYGYYYHYLYLHSEDFFNEFCKEHLTYYNKEKGCPICSKTKFFVTPKVEENLTKVFEDKYAVHYSVFGTSYCLKTYKFSSFSDKSQIEQLEKNIDYFVKQKSYGNSISSILNQDAFLPEKKAFKDNIFIGYVYKWVDFSEDRCVEINNEKINNRIRVTLLQKLVEQIKCFAENDMELIANPFTDVFFIKDFKENVQLVNVEFWYYKETSKKTLSFCVDYIKNVIKNDSNIDLKSNWLLDQSLNSIETKLKLYIENNKKYCKLHKIYYDNNSMFCPKCSNLFLNTKSKDLDEMLENRKLIGKGGEAEIYSFDDDKVLKVFKKDIDIMFKIEVISKVLAKRKILETENLENLKYHYIIPKELFFDSEDGKLAYTMKRVDGNEIMVLRDVSILKKLQFTRKDILEILITMGEGIEALHSKAGIFIGDLNGGNVLFDSNKDVYFLDFDGMGIDNIVPEALTRTFVDPISQKNGKIGMKDDWYSYAIQCFYYLTHVHPFKGKYVKKHKVMDVVTRMEKRISVLGDYDILLPAIAEPWDWMNEDLKDKFLAIFEGDNRESLVPLLKEQYESLYGHEA